MNDFGELIVFVACIALTIGLVELCRAMMPSSTKPRPGAKP